MGRARPRPLASWPASSARLGKKVVIAAGDTFRAAAVEQLQVWGDRAGVPVLTAPAGSVIRPVWPLTR